MDFEPDPNWPPYARENSNCRADELRAALRPIADIRPVLTSRYVIKRWLDAGASSVLFGASNVGKSFLALDLAMHVAAGRDWQGHRVRSSGRAIYVAAEGGHGFSNRIEAIRRTDPELVHEAYGFSLLPTALDLCASGDGQALLDAIGEPWPSLVVIDTLARSMGSGDENTARDMGQFIRNLDLIREKTGAHVMIVHHSGKDGTKGARGSSSLRAAVDTEIELTRTDDVVQAEAVKQRDMPCGALFAYRLQDVTIGLDEDVDEVTSAVIVATEAITKKKRISGAANVALQALSDALAQHGEKKSGDMFPHNRQCVTLERWRDYCDRHSLSDGSSTSAARNAFNRAKTKLHELEVIRIVDGYVWRCEG